MTKATPSHSFLAYGKQTIEQDDIDAVVDALTSDFLTTGPEIAKFEEILAKTVKAKEAVVVGNGTQALHLACMAAGLEKGDFAIVPSLTFLATANAVRYCDAGVLFCDVNPDTGLIDINHLKSIISDNSDKSIKAVLPVHLAGQIADLDAIRQIADENNITVIADSCHALDSRAGEYVVGSCEKEDMATFSFHPVKTIAMGEGGAITLNDTNLANKMRQLRTHGMAQRPERGVWFYEMPELGYNYRATDIQCALGTSQLKKLDQFVSKRTKLANLYDRLLADYAPKIKPPHRVENQTPAWHLYAARFDFEQIGLSRDEVMKKLKERNIGTQVHYIPVHSQPYYQDLYGDITLEGADTYYSNTLSLPLFPLMEENDVEYVVQSLIDVCSL